MEKYIKRAFLIPTGMEVEGILGEVSLCCSAPFKMGFIGERLIWIESGAGKVNAALATFWLLNNFWVDELWVVGICGAYPDSGLSIGDVVLATKEFYGDELFKPLEFEMRVLDLPCPSGAFVTLSVLPGSVDMAKSISLRFGAIAENMEGAAVAHAASLFGVVPVEVRGVSNVAGIRDKSRWDVKKALAALKNFLMDFLI